MITCEWHQLAYLAIITAGHQADCTSRFSLHITVRLATKPKMPIFRPKNSTKNYTYLSSNICSKMKSLPNTANLKLDQNLVYILLAVFLSTFSPGYTSAILSDPLSVACLKLPHSRPKRSLGNSAFSLVFILPLISIFFQRLSSTHI